jgi:hypothetical protein
MVWESIADLPEDWESLVSSEVDSLAKAWEQTYEELKDTPMLQEFNRVCVVPGRSRQVLLSAFIPLIGLA